jgi:hypothetical protein
MQILFNSATFAFKIFPKLIKATLFKYEKYLHFVRSPHIIVNLGLLVKSYGEIPFYFFCKA